MWRFMRAKRVVGCMVLVMGLAAACTPLAKGQAHEHGVAEVGVAIDGSSAQVEFTAPGSAIMGFEHEAKTAADKKKMADAFAKFKANASKMFVFDAALGCQVNPLQVAVAEEHGHSHEGEGHKHEGQDHDHGHADVRALIDVKCKQALKGTTLRFNVKSVFPEVQTLRVQVVGNDFQTGAELKGARNTVKLSQ